MDNQSTSGLAIAGLISSFFCSILGLVLCVMALNEIGKSEGKLGGGGLAGAGIGISVVGMLIGILVMASRNG